MINSELDVGGQERSSKFADQRRVGYVETPSSGKIKGTIIHGADTDLAKVAAAASVTLVFSTDTGVDYTVRDACCTKPPVLKTEGEADVEFEGNPAF
jgi:hypothetical protein